MKLNADCLVPGRSGGPILFADVGVSFMGGVHPQSGEIIDTHHPLYGENVAGKILAIPSGRGSCAGSLGIFELLLNGQAPAALVFQHQETILTLGVLIAKEMFDRGIPVICLQAQDFAALATARFAVVDHDCLEIVEQLPRNITPLCTLEPLDLSGFALTPEDQEMLAGRCGEAAQLAMRLIIRTAMLEGANRLVDIEMAHIDGCFYHGPGSLEFARKLLAMGGHVKVPSSMNAVCVDRQLWRDLGVSSAIGLPSDALADAYVQMGVKPTYTCAPYLLDEAPLRDQQIAWGESNAVVFANSVLGARTMKYPDYLDILVAITGRAPHISCHVAQQRHATLRIDVPRPHCPDDAYFPALGYHIGKIATNAIPVICGLEGLAASHDDLKAFGAAFATTSAAAMFHIVGITPEAQDLAQATGGIAPAQHVVVTLGQLRETWDELNSARTAQIDLVSLGNPHFSLSECRRLAQLCAGRKICDTVRLVVTCGREVFAKATAAGYVQTIRDFGGTFMNDTCWCLIGAPIIAPETGNILTNSGKYAHYGPAVTGKDFHFGGLELCVEAACSGRVDAQLPAWLQQS